jgi:hypothetical protein
MSATNSYCDALGIQVPCIEVAKKSADANWYSLLIVALLERGEPITLEDAAIRFDEAGVAPLVRALAALKRCRPARPPIYRDGDLYALDPYDDEADLWAFRLGLRPPKAPALKIVRPDPGPLPSPKEPLTVSQLDEAWREDVPSGWSAQRIAICVLDAHATAMHPGAVIAFVSARTDWSRLSADSAQYWRRGAPIRVREDGLWELSREHPAVSSARQAIAERISSVRASSARRGDPTVWEANRKRFEREREAHAESLAEMSRVIIHAFPKNDPEAVVLVDVNRHEIGTFVGDEIASVNSGIKDYKIIAAVDVRALLRILSFKPGNRRLGELGPPQKTRRLTKRGHTLKITTELLVRGSCRISRPFGDEKVLHRYLRDGQLTKLRRRLEADAKSLHALYQYGRLHGAVRLKWGFLDEMIPAPWVHRDEHTLHDLMNRAHEMMLPLEVIVGTTPGWAEPWSRRQLAFVERENPGWRTWLVDEHHCWIDTKEVQLARLTRRDQEMR